MKFAVITCGTFEPGFRGGGPIRSVSQIIDTVSDGVDVRLLTSDRDLGDSAPYPGLSGRTVQRGSASVTYLRKHSARQWFRFVREVRGRRIDLLYLNGLWQPWFSQLPLLLTFLHVLDVRTVLIAPRGELSPGALELKSLKKRAALPALRFVLRRLNVRWHASTALEAEEIRRAIPEAEQRIVVAGVGIVDVQVPSAVVEPNDLPPRLVFIGRISPKKNLGLVLGALASVDAELIFDIYGPIEDERYWSVCRSRLAALPLNIAATYRGELAPADVPRTFARYDAFVFPTRGENFGHVIVESLAASCPVICSDRTPWTALLDAGGGAVVAELSTKKWGRVLEEWARKPSGDLLKARAAARNAFLTWHDVRDRSNVLDLVLREVWSH